MYKIFLGTTFPEIDSIGIERTIRNPKEGLFLPCCCGQTRTVNAIRSGIFELSFLELFYRRAHDFLRHERFRNWLNQSWNGPSKTWVKWLLVSLIFLQSFSFCVCVLAEPCWTTFLLSFSFFVFLAFFLLSSRTGCWSCTSFSFVFSSILISLPPLFLSLSTKQLLDRQLFFFLFSFVLLSVGAAVMAEREVRDRTAVRETSKSELRESSKGERDRAQ